MFNAFALVERILIFRVEVGIHGETRGESRRQVQFFVAVTGI